MDIGAIIGLVTAGLGLAGAAVGFGIKLYNAIKIIVKDKDWKKVTSIAMTAIEAAEKTGKSGADKKEQVIEATKAGCAEAGIEVGTFLDDLNTFIDNIIGFANSMAVAKKEGKVAAKAAE